MPDLTFTVEGAEAVTYAASPLLAFKLRVANAYAEEQIASVVLTCQIRLDVTKRRYTDHERERLRDLFGEPARWGDTLRNMLWTFAATNVPPFTGSIVANLPVTCTYDFNLAAVKYFYSLEDGEVPLSFLFSGTVFYRSEEEGLQVEQIPWEKEATFRLPIQIWQQMIDHYYPNSAWLYLRRDAFDRLYRYKIDHALPTWEQVIDKLLPDADQGSKIRSKQTPSPADSGPRPPPAGAHTPDPRAEVTS
ncbi:MAG: DUF6084 family protein [Chloroflexia bacterium]